ncbi:MAG: tetratricopeptide repeat protein [Alphaproteobacteria bacterium]|nr:tetratricopeptide repeat protein [Alphaproteobacteria bacterium]
MVAALRLSTTEHDASPKRTNIDTAHPPSAMRLVVARVQSRSISRQILIAALRNSLRGGAMRQAMRRDTTTGDAAAALDRQGVEHLKAGRFDDAAPYFRQALALDPRAHQPLSHLALVLQYQNDLAQAFHRLARAVDLQPRDPMLHMQMGQLLVKANRGEEALRAFRITLELDPQLAQGWCGVLTWHGESWTGMPRKMRWGMIARCWRTGPPCYPPMRLCCTHFRCRSCATMPSATSPAAFLSTTHRDSGHAR